MIQHVYMEIPAGRKTEQFFISMIATVAINAQKNQLKKKKIVGTHRHKMDLE